MNSLGKTPGRSFLIFLIFLACKTPPAVKDISPVQPVKPEATAIPFYPLQDEQDLTILIEQLGNARVVLLGEATHGTAEFYNWRTAITKRLIQEKGFDFIAVEGDWQDAYHINNLLNRIKKTVRKRLRY